LDKIVTRAEREGGGDVTNKQSRAINRLRKQGKLLTQDEQQVRAWQKLHDELWPRPTTGMFLGPVVQPRRREEKE